jgi:alkanesulfonate monooxygenase SsuD/methylene tetrahydromethanopterin reductase-like flavin-dependent oxidoreductase (luciferase family)
MGKPTFGIFDHIEGIKGTSTELLLRERLEFVRIADQSGFTGFYLAEHHGSELCMAPNQDLIIAAASQVTARIRMGPMVKLLPLHHPVQTIEDLCVLDNLTGGRLEYGVGRGVAPVEHNWFGSDWQTSEERFKDNLAIIARALKSGEISAEGSKFHSFRTMPMATLPCQRNIPFWYPANPVKAGKYGFKLMFPGPIPREVYEIYVETWHKHKNDPIRFDGPDDKPLVAAVMVIAIDRDEKVARDIAARGYEGLGRRTTAVHRWDAELIGEEAAEAAIAALQGLLSTAEDNIEYGHGTPARIVDRFAEVIEQGMVEHFVLQTPTGDITMAEARSTLELFCGEVQPVLERL